MALFMEKQVAQRREDVASRDVKELGKDVFTLLIQANEQESSKLKLSDDELVCLLSIFFFSQSLHLCRLAMFSF